MTESSCKQNLPVYESHCMKQKPCRNKTEIHSGNSTPTTTKVFAQKAKHTVPQLRRSKSFDSVSPPSDMNIQHWRPLVPCLFSEPPCTPSMVSGATEPVNLTHVPFIPGDTQSQEMFLSPIPRLCRCSCVLSPLLSLTQPPWSSVFCTALQRDFHASKLSNNYCFTNVVIPVSVLLTHCNLLWNSFWQSLRGFSPSPHLWGCEPSYAVTRGWDWVTQKPRSPCIKLKAFCVYWILAGRRGAGGPGPDPSAVLSIDGSKKLLLLLLFLSRAPPREDAPGGSTGRAVQHTAHSSVNSLGSAGNGSVYTRHKPETALQKNVCSTFATGQ